MMSSDPMALFARALADAAAGRPGRLYFCHEDGQKDAIDPAPLVRPFVFPRVERELLERLGALVLPGARLLDLGCGAGRHTRWLAERGFAVDAIDASPSVTNVARLLGVQARTATLWDLDQDLPYDGVLLLGNSIGMVGGPEHLAPFFERLAKLTPIVVLDSATPKADRALARLHLEYDDQVGSWFDWLTPSAEMISDAARQARFETELVASQGDGRFGAVLVRS